MLQVNLPPPLPCFYGETDEPLYARGSSSVAPAAHVASTTPDISGANEIMRRLFPDLCTRSTPEYSTAHLLPDAGRDVPNQAHNPSCPSSDGVRARLFRRPPSPSENPARPTNCQAHSVSLNKSEDGHLIRYIMRSREA